jgi:hypothetical protein
MPRQYYFLQKGSRRCHKIYPVFIGHIVWQAERKENQAEKKFSLNKIKAWNF